MLKQPQFENKNSPQGGLELTQEDPIGFQVPSPAPLQLNITDNMEI